MSKTLALSHNPPSCKMTSCHLLLVVVNNLQNGFYCLSPSKPAKMCVLHRDVI